MTSGTISVVGERLHQARTAKNLSQRKLAELVKVRPQTIQSIESGRIRRSRYLPDIASVLGVTLPWLRGEEDEAFQERRANSRRIPFLGWDQVGRFREVLYEIRTQLRGLFEEKTETFGKPGEMPGEDAFALRVEDFAMAPLLLPGDRVIVDPAVEVLPGDLVLALVDQPGQNATPMVRRFRLLEEGVRFDLLPANSNYPIISVDRAMGKHGQVVGPVIELRRALEVLRHQL